VLWSVVVLAGLATTGVAWVVDVPLWLPRAGACALSSGYAVALAARTGGRPWVTGALAAVLSVAAVVSQRPWLLTGVAVMTGALAAVLAVMCTVPAARFTGVVREVTVAIVVAAVGAFAVDAYAAPVSLERVHYLSLGFALLGALGLVYRLGAGLQGLGRRGAIAVLSGIVLLAVILAYTEALAHWGSPALVARADELAARSRSALGAVPRPLEVLLGFPALAWGISTRARRRQGWWVCAFGATGLAVVAMTLTDPAMSLAEGGLTLLYSSVLGLGLGYLVIRADKFLTGPRGRRARMLEEAAAHRPEPGRTHALL
jgi:hypothetical protein